MILHVFWYSQITPGEWVEDAGCKRLSGYDLPKPISLILIGPKGSGKSSLVNTISKVFEDDKLASKRAQVTSICHLFFLT